ncbi:Six-hairpin glycosidase-like protein [Dunaliella salina]|nr:Six-hairpin glycosidase-like protein [Dunaliella salina]|eukprot:KAF5835573.1 Six-hairpin glycosidase-like protein [Dunaliella salina]
MSYIQAISGRGGWPMSVWLTPDLEPIYGGTYYPSKDMIRGGQLMMPSFKTVLMRIGQLWESNREDLKAKGTSVMSQLSAALSAEASGVEAETIGPDAAEHALTTCTAQLARRFDPDRGGFGGAPKFPRPCEINNLLCTYDLQKAQGKEGEANKALHMAIFSLEKMAAGGMYDQIGGGFHRYSVDEFWHVPHFEKMCYDNPQLVLTYLAAFQITKANSLAMVARGVLDYLRRDMTSKEGGLFSAEDADSLDPSTNHKSEGFFYVWTQEEVEKVLGPERAPLFCDAYSIRKQGNCTLSPRSDPMDEFRGKNVPILLQPLERIAVQNNLGLEELHQKLADCRKDLHAARAARPRPGLDDKIVTAWNGYGISAFARAARTLAAEEPPAGPLFPVEGVKCHEYLQCAERTAEFVRDHLWDGNKRTLLRSYRVAPSPVEGFADDYACLIQGLLDLYEAGGDTQWLQWAMELQQRMDELFLDPAGGGYYATTGADKSILIRIKDEYDGAEPTASSVAAANLQRLAHLVPGKAGSGERWMNEADKTLASLQGQHFEIPLAVPQLCCSGYLKLASPFKQVIVAYDSFAPHAPPFQALMDAVHAPFAPSKAVIHIDVSDPACKAFWQDHNPAALDMVQAHFEKHGVAPTAFICQNFTCQAPTSSPVDVAKQLQQSGEPKQPTPFTMPGM